MRTRPRAGAAVALLAAAAVTAGCSTSGDSGPKTGDPTSTSPPTISSSTSPSSPPTHSSSSTDPAAAQAQLEQNAQNAWLTYWKTSVNVTDYLRSQWKPRMAAVAVQPIYGELVNSVVTQYDALGEVGYGYIVSRPYWPTAPKPGAKKVVMGDCFDGTHTGAKIAKTGQIKTVGEPRTNVHVTLVLGADRKWRVMQIEYLKALC